MGDRFSESPAPEFYEQGFLRMMTGLDPVVVEQLAAEIKIKPLTLAHWHVIDFVKSYYQGRRNWPPGSKDKQGDQHAPSGDLRTVSVWFGERVSF